MTPLNEFNKRSANIGCKARIGGTNKNQTFYEFMGGYEKGFEIWYKIPVQRFVVLTNKYPELQN